MICTLLELPLFSPPPREDRNVQWLLKELRSTSDWITAEALVLLYAPKATENEKRRIRQLAEAVGDEVISGQQGYKHITHATPEEIRHSSNNLISQGKKLITRGIAQRRRAHGIVG